jgi:hypothetical protein
MDLNMGLGFQPFEQSGLLGDPNFGELDYGQWINTDIT